MGFPLPTGALAGMLADSRREYHDKLSSLSRDVAIKQAELAQENLRHAIDTAVSLETQLMNSGCSSTPRPTLRWPRRSRRAYTDTDTWKGQVIAQARQALFQAVQGLGL